MLFTRGKTEEIETYRDVKIIIEHNLNLFERVNDNSEPIFTLCGMGRCFQGSIEGTRKFIDDMYIKYSDDY